MEIRELFQKKIHNETTKDYQWQNRQWLDIVLSILAFIVIYLLACLIAITFD